jgi:hypothetical protein
VAWEKRERGGRYYTRSRKESGRVVREYVGTGPVAELAASMDALERQRREDEARTWRAEQERIEALTAPVEELCDAAELLARAALVCCQWPRRSPH